jgi:hypothetical protein
VTREEQRQEGVGSRRESNNELGRLRRGIGLEVGIEGSVGRINQKISDVGRNRKWSIRERGSACRQTPQGPKPFAEKIQEENHRTI